MRQDACAQLVEQSAVQAQLVAALRNLAPDAFDFERFKAALKKLPAQRVIWANDTCHSGASLAKEATILVSSRGSCAARAGRV